MGIVIDIPYGPQLYAPSGENRKHRISPHDSYFHVHKHVNHQHGTSHELICMHLYVSIALAQCVIRANGSSDGCPL